MAANSLLEQAVSRHVSDETKEHRAAMVLANTHAQVAPVPPYTTSGLAHPSVGWSGSGGTQLTLASGNAMRICANPWHTSTPVIARTLPVGVDGRFVVNAASSIPCGTEFRDDGALGSTTRVSYCNTNSSDSGFPQVAGITPVAQLAGGHMIVTVVCPENTSAVGVAIGQQEVRGIGVGPLSESTILQEHMGFNPCLPDYANDESLATPYGSLNNFKETELIVGTTNLSTKTFSIPIKPSHGQWYEMLDFDNDAYFTSFVSNTISATQGGGQPVYNDTVDTFGRNSIVAAGVYNNTDVGFAYTSLGNPFLTVGSPIADLTNNTNHTLAVSSLKYITNDIFATAAGSFRLIEQAPVVNAAPNNNDQSATSFIPPMGSVVAQTAASLRRSRPFPSINAAIIDGMPLVEIKCLSGTCMVQVHFKLHYNIAVTMASPHFERSQLPLNISPHYLLDHVSTHAGAGDSVEAAVKQSLSKTINASKKPALTAALTDSGAAITGNALVVFTPKTGVKDAPHHDQESHHSFGEKLLGGIKSGLSYIGSGAEWLWKHKGDVSRIGGSAVSAIAAARQAGVSSPYALMGAGIAGAVGGQQPQSYAQVARRAIGQRYPRIEELE